MCRERAGVLRMDSSRATSAAWSARKNDFCVEREG